MKNLGMRQAADLLMFLDNNEGGNAVPPLVDYYVQRTTEDDYTSRAGDFYIKRQDFSN